MRFDFIAGNPPYQEQTAAVEHGQPPRRNIFQYFQLTADAVAAEGTVLIYPGGRWIQGFGKGLAKFSRHQLADPHLSRVVFYPDTRRLFPDSDTADGLSVVLKRMNRSDCGCRYQYMTGGKFVTVSLPVSSGGG